MSECYVPYQVPNSGHSGVVANTVLTFYFIIILFDSIRLQIEQSKINNYDKEDNNNPLQKDSRWSLKQMFWKKQKTS